MNRSFTERVSPREGPTIHKKRFYGTELSPNELLRGKDQPSTKSASMEPSTQSASMESGDRVGKETKSSMVEPSQPLLFRPLVPTPWWRNRRTRPFMTMV
eukprot:TRINITY_DN476_c0_g2_i16.p2 TRINITY_DN476_c0_g2~~TRINITY_DN476_c0_g2_i16.p2  ORF type:complete len:100 (+),score=1.65 TRINITY_DN476_c0_g2_i16:598-897(+)